MSAATCRCSTGSQDTCGANVPAATDVIVNSVPDWLTRTPKAASTNGTWNS
ncbi:hypothetical protein ACFQL1_15040 [Halomicroarcula sp. GCM10025709]|uniref:hypothetical protein n=1 Tax=Halomicroarcula sp. GCM10025709 TaxID=3252669 RepID=UPI00361F84F7